MHARAPNVALMAASLRLEERLARKSDSRASPTVEQLRRVCAKGSPDAVLRALGDMALADAASEAHVRAPDDAPELTETAWAALMRSAPQQARQASAQLLAFVPGLDSQPQLFEPVNGTAREGPALKAAETIVPVQLSGTQLKEVSQRWAQARTPNTAEHPALPLAKVWAQRQCLWIDDRESRILPAMFAAGFVALHPSQDSEPTLWPVGSRGSSPNVAASPAVRLAIEIGCGIPYDARSDGTVLLAPLTVDQLLAMLYTDPLRPSAWRRNRWGRISAGLRQLERVCSVADPERRPAIEILSIPGANAGPDDKVRLAVNTPSRDNGPRLPREAMRSLGRGYGRGLWLMVSAARCWDRLIARQGKVPSPVRSRKPTKSMTWLPTVGVDDLVTMCRWPGPASSVPAAVSRARSAAATTLEALADAGWLTVASSHGWHGAHSDLVGPARSAAGVARSQPVQVLPAPWWCRDSVTAPPAPRQPRGPSTSS